ncbi:hypothetical protein D3C81_1358570 [compost metagenome]
MARQGLIGIGLVAATDEVAVGVIRLHQGEERDAGEGGQQLAEGALKQLARQDPLQRAGSLDGHIQIGFHHLLPGDPHEGEHSSQLLTPLFIGINDQHPHSHHIYLPYTPDAKLLFLKCL